ncbi:MAG: hypothetical protein K1X67_23840 [Fimbriimonadaceae bacterium]|nr:hypothetical protein [Fimbriimonadaceae bacterium]
MSVLGIVVLAILGVSTVGLILYVGFFLPRRVEEQLRGSMRVFSTAVELRFPSHRGLTDRVIALSRAVGRELKLSRRQLADLETAAYLRDIGLCGVPYRLVNGSEPHDWSADDRHIYDRHAEVSATMLEVVPSLQRFARIVRSHHASEDQLDSSPFLSVKSLPIESRILNVVTTYTWSERVQGDLIAREIIRDGRGTHFDEEVVDTFLTVLTSARVREVASPALIR